MNPVLNSGAKEARDIEQMPFINTPKLVECLSRNYIKKVSCGLIHTIAVDSQSSCFSWGSNSHG